MIVMLNDDRTHNSYDEWKVREDKLTGERLLELWAMWSIRQEETQKEFDILKNNDFSFTCSEVGMEVDHDVEFLLYEIDSLDKLMAVKY